MRHFKVVAFGSALFGAGIGFGGIVVLNQTPNIVVVERWRTVTTAPSPPVVLGHTSLNEDELRNLLKIQAEPLPPPPTTTTTAPPPLPTTTTTLPPTTTTTILPPTTTATTAESSLKSNP